MSIKRLLPFLIILVVLLGLGLLKRGSQRQPSLESQADLTALVESGLEADDIAKLEVFASAKADEKVILEKDGDDWLVRSHFDAPVKADALDNYLKSLVVMRGEFRAKASDDAQLADYSLKDDEAFRVLAYKTGADKPVVDLLFGKAPDQNTVFVRKAGDQTVYVESTNLRRDAGLFGDDMTEAPKADKWLDKDILKLDKESITKVALTTPDKSMTFEKREVEVPAPDPVEGDDADAETPPAAPTMTYEWAMVSGGKEKTF